MRASDALCLGAAIPRKRIGSDYTFDRGGKGGEAKLKMLF